MLEVWQDTLFVGRDGTNREIGQTVVRGRTPVLSVRVSKRQTSAGNTATKARSPPQPEIRSRRPRQYRSFTETDRRSALPCPCGIPRNRCNQIRTVDVHVRNRTIFRTVQIPRTLDSGHDHDENRSNVRSSFPIFLLQPSSSRRTILFQFFENVA